ncbi:MAG: hypothetical protein GC204_05115 [Chloroflexi bacterium]|nr:hypothetical protein [Chloroflexota bacterium]
MAQTQRNTFGAVLLIGLGILFLIGQIFNINFWEMVGFSWPALVLIPGVIFLALAFTGDKKLAAFAFPGSIITGTGALLWYQTLTGNWQSWAYAWTLYPGFVGLAMMFVALRNADKKTYGVGRSMVNYSLIAFLAGAAFFELFIFHANGALTGWLVPLGLIGVGGYLFISGRSGGSEKRKFEGVTFSSPRKRSLSPSDELQQRIDEAIHEDDPVEPLV